MLKTKCLNKIKNILFIDCKKIELILNWMLYYQVIKATHERMEFNKHTKKELQEQCEKYGIKNYKSKNKDELIQLLKSGHCETKNSESITIEKIQETNENSCDSESSNIDVKNNRDSMSSWNGLPTKGSFIHKGRYLGLQRLKYLQIRLVNSGSVYYHLCIKILSYQRIAKPH